jgi:hypothetical protein
MAIPLILALGGTVVRAVAPRVIQQLMRQGAKRATTQQIKKAGGEKGMSTITSVKQAKNLKPTRPSLKPSTKVVKPKSGITSQQRSALSDMGGQTVKLSKPTGGAGRANLKPKAPSMKPTTPSMKPKSPSMKPQRPSLKPKPKVVKPRVSAPKAPPSRPSVPSGGSRFTGFPRRPTPPKAPPSRPISRTQRAANVGKAAVASGVAASMIPNKKEGPKTSKAAIPTPKPRPKTKEGGPGRKFAKPSEGKDPRGNQIKATPGKMIMPKKFDGGYNSKTQKLVNITVDGKKATYEIPKGMTTKQAKSLLTSTAKKKAGGTPGKYKMKPAPMPKIPPRKKKPGFKAKPAPMPKIPPRNPEFKGKPAIKKTPTKLKGFSKLPEKVQKKISPKLAAKYETGGSIKSGVARQVKGFGAARRPKK